MIVKNISISSFVFAGGVLLSTIFRSLLVLVQVVLFYTSIVIVPGTVSWAQSSLRKERRGSLLRVPAT
jgi:hypothetical protein